MIAFINFQVDAQSYGVFDVDHLIVKYIILQQVFRLFTPRTPLVWTFPDEQNDQWFRVHLFVKYVILQKVFRLITPRIPLVRTFPDAHNDQWTISESVRISFC